MGSTNGTGRCVLVALCTYLHVVRNLLNRLPVSYTDEGQSPVTCEVRVTVHLLSSFLWLNLLCESEAASQVVQKFLAVFHLSELSFIGIGVLMHLVLRIDQFIRHGRPQALEHCPEHHCEGFIHINLAAGLPSCLRRNI